MSNKVNRQTKEIIKKKNGTSHVYTTEKKAQEIFHSLNSISNTLRIR